MKCNNWVQQDSHDEVATHRIGVDSNKVRVCEACYNAIIAAAIAGEVQVWDCN